MYRMLGYNKEFILYVKPGGMQKISLLHKAVLTKQNEGKKTQKVTPVPLRNVKKPKLTTIPQNFQLFVETFFKEICLISIRFYKTFY